MKDSNFLKENNARHMWHPMAHPADMLNNPPRIIQSAEGVRITDIDGNGAAMGNASQRTLLRPPWGRPSGPDGIRG